MEALWNQLNLKRPPCILWNVSTNDFDASKFLQEIRNILSDFKTFEVLNVEAALLSRLIYRMKSKFRSDKGLKYMEKVNRSLLNYLNLSIEREYELLKNHTEINGRLATLPSRQTLEYVLIRTQGFAKLMCRIEETSMAAANILKGRLSLGQSWTVAMIALAVVSRIWFLARHIIQCSCKWYNSVYIYRTNFDMVGEPWLPDEYVLPNDLNQWLELPWSNNIFWKKLPKKDDWDKSIFDLIHQDRVSQQDLQIVEDVVINPEEKKGNSKPKKNEINSMSESHDLGTPVSRESFAKESYQKIDETKNDKQKKKAESEKNKLCNIRSEKTLVDLLQAESFTGFDEVQWKKFKKRLKRLVMKLTKNNACRMNDELFNKLNRKIKNGLILDAASK